MLVTYDENGFYGHPDHIQAHRITMAAVEATGTDAKVYWTTFPRSAMDRFMQVMAELGEEPDREQEGDAEFPEIGLPDDEVSTWVDVRAFSNQKFESLAAHASQEENIVFLRMGRERFADLMGVETFVRVDPKSTGEREDDLFDTLR